jgi:uncharacterized repeat protein (TIGR01451 family)
VVTGPVDQGQTYRYRQTVKNSSGVLANAGTVTFTVTLPDGTSATPAVVSSGTGLYDVAYTTTQAGLHQIRGSATGGTLGSEYDFWTDAFTAEEPARLLIGVDETLAHLRAQQVIVGEADREQLRYLCSVATDAVEMDLGMAIVKRTVTETFDGGRRELNLGVKPPRASDGGSIAISSVTENGVAITGCQLRKNGWRLVRSSWPTTRWASGYENIAVTYVPGCEYGSALGIAQYVAKNVAQLMWQSSQQAEHPFLDQFVSRTTIGSRTTIATSAFATISEVANNAYRALRSVNAA